MSADVKPKVTTLVFEKAGSPLESSLAQYRPSSVTLTTRPSA
jgi:hypothetical protein